MNVGSLFKVVLGIGVLACLALGASSCETPQSKYVATPLDPKGHPAAPGDGSRGIIISGEELESMSSPLFGAVEVTFENRSKDWLHLRTTSIRFGTEAVDKAVQLPAGDDLWAWQEATLRRNALRLGNERTVLSAVFGAGVLTSALAGRTSALGAAGHLVTLASLGAWVSEESAASANSGAKLFPAGHLLDESISVPPGLFAKRWIVFFTPEPRVTGCLRRMQLGYQGDDGQIAYVRLPFRDPQGRSEWQAQVCGVSTAYSP